MIVHFSAHISKWELVCKFGVIFHISIISCLCSRFHVRNQWFFYSVITFSYIKCFVHSYTVDVVFTLSYLNITHWNSKLYLLCISSFLTQWGRVTRMCYSKLTSTGSDNGLTPGRRQAIIWTNNGILLIRSLGTNSVKFSSKFQTFFHSISSGNLRPFCLGLNVSKDRMYLDKMGKPVCSAAAGVYVYNLWCE